MAYIIITNKTNKAICNKGTIARRIEFNTTCKPENRYIKINLDIIIQCNQFEKKN